MVTFRACRMPNATAAVVVEDPIGLGPSCNLISALSLMAGRLKANWLWRRTAGPGQVQRIASLPVHWPGGKLPACRKVSAWPRNKGLAIPGDEVQRYQITVRPVAFIGDVNARRAPAFPKRKGVHVPDRPSRHKQTETFEFRLQMEAAKLRKQAEGMPAGIRRDELLQKARQADSAVHMNQWLASPFPRP